jgi:hypothetical protein
MYIEHRWTLTYASTGQTYRVWVAVSLSFVPYRYKVAISAEPYLDVLAFAISGPLLPLESRL